MSLFSLSADAHHNTEQILNLLSQQKQLAGIPHTTPLTKKEFTQLTKHDSKFVIYNCIKKNTVHFYQEKKCIVPECPDKDKIFKDYIDFFNHVIPKHTNLEFQCPIESCKQTLSTYNSIKRHCAQSHNIPNDIYLFHWLLQKKE